MSEDTRPMDPKVTRDQIGVMALATVGASDLRGSEEGLMFNARIHPRRKDLKRSTRPRVMTVRITLGLDDLYRVRVTYTDRANGQAPHLITHFEVEGIYAEDLSRLIVSLDSGTEQGWL